MEMSEELLKIMILSLEYYRPDRPVTWGELQDFFQDILLELKT